MKIKKIKVSNLKVPRQISDRLGVIQNEALKLNWQIDNLHPSNFILNLSKDGMKCNVYLSTLTVQTVINHPKKGRTQLNRKKLNISQIVQILQNPRIHTGKGYYKKS